MGKKTVAAGIFLLRDDHKILVCHPTNHAPDFWSIPKGKVDGEETTLQAAIRETFEETNIDVKAYKAIKALTPVNYGHKKKILHPYILWEYANNNFDWNAFDIKCNSNVPEARGGFPEMDGFKWVSITEAYNLLHETQVACLKDIESFINSDEYFKLTDF